MSAPQASRHLSRWGLGPPTPGPRILVGALAVAIGVVLLGVWYDAAYEQFPLYSVNQNTYLIHGLAQGGRGLLAGDWMARTVDPTPVFSRLVAWSYRLLPEKAFYLEHAMLAGVYVVALVGIARQWHRRRARAAPARARSAMVAMAALLVALHSGVLERLTMVGGYPASRCLHEGVALQYVLGRMYQPSAFGILLVVSIWLFLRGRWLGAVIASAVAATVHPTYVISAVTLSVGYALVILVRRRDVRAAVRLLLVSAVLLLPIVTYSALAFRATTPALTAQAFRYLVHVRIPHHAIPQRWFRYDDGARVAIVVLALLAVRKSRIFAVLFVPFVVTLALTLVQVFWPHDALALMFPWRLSVFLVPIASTLLVSVVAFRLTAHRYHRLAATAFVALAIAPTVAGGEVMRKVLANPQQTRLTTFVGATRSPGHVYLIPPELELFRLQTAVPVLIDRKSHPYKDVEVLEWVRRNEQAQRFYQRSNDCAALRDLSAAYGVDRALVRSPGGQSPCAGWAAGWKDRDFTVWEKAP